MVSTKFTVDNLGEISNIVKGDVLPLRMIEWSCKAQRFLEPEKQAQGGEIRLLQHAVLEDDMELLKFMIEIEREQKALLAEEEIDQRYYEGVFYTAIMLGRTTILAELIKVRVSSSSNLKV